MLKVCKLYEVIGDDEVGAPCRSGQSRGVGVVVRRRGVTRPGQTPRHVRSHYWHRGRQLRSRGAPVGQRPNGVARGVGRGGSGCSGGGLAADGEGGQHCVRLRASRRKLAVFFRSTKRPMVVWMDGWMDETVLSVQAVPMVSVSKVAS